MPGRPPAGFTLMEVIVAVLIVGMALAALATVLRTAVRAWRIGHGASEIYQTARIAQDVIRRDLDNMFYLSPTNYNKTFDRQMEMLVQQTMQQGGLGNSSRQRQQASDAAKDKAGQAGDPTALLDPSTIAPPIDLAFRGIDGGKTDNLSFARGYLPRQDAEAVAGGIRRVSYYIRDKVLYRTQCDAFGLTSETDYNPMPPTSQYGGAGQALAKQNEDQAGARSQVLAMFYRPDGIEQDLDTTNQKALPAREQTEEPLCEGVEIFDVTYGYFKNGGWVETKDWDSQQRKYRNPPADNPDASNSRRDPSAPVDPAQIQNGSLVVNNNPDGLPGYMAIQIGVRLPVGQGKIHSFTVYYSLPAAQETDVNQGAQQTNVAQARRRSSSGDNGDSQL